MNKFKRIEQPVTKEFQKDIRDENFLNRMNTALAPYEYSEYEELSETYPTLHIVGVPRSGTTLVSQLLASCTDLGYINNLIARFWEAPVYGIRLSKMLVPPGTSSSFTSHYGRTGLISEPHEFGYFWSSILNYKEMYQKDNGNGEFIDWNRLKLILLNMTHAFAKPIVFKSFLLGWHVAEMQQILPKTCWIYIKRDPLETALSIAKLRKNLLGERDQWASLKPKEYEWLKNEPYWRQIAGQVYFLEKNYSIQLAKVSPANKLEINYEQLCSKPINIVEQVIELLERQGGKITLQNIPPQEFTRHSPSVESHPDARLIAEALHEFYGYEYDKAP